MVRPARGRESLGRAPDPAAAGPRGARSSSSPPSRSPRSTPAATPGRSPRPGGRRRHSVADSPTVARAGARPPTPPPRCSRTPSRCARGHRRRLRRGDGAWTAPGTPTPTPTRSAGSSSATSAGPRGDASSPRSTPARWAPRSAPWCRCATAAEVVALVSVGITIARIDDQLRRDLPCDRCSPALRHPRGRSRRRLADQPPAAAPDPRAWASARSPGCTSTTAPCCTPYARGCCWSTPTAGCSWSTTRRGGCSPCPTTSSAARSPTSACHRAWSRPPWRGPPSRTPSTSLGEHVLVVSSAPASWEGAEVGAVVTLRDRTELQPVTGELDVVRGLTESLRAQTHEAANRLHTVVSLIEMGRPEQAVDFATEELHVAQDLTDQVVGAVEDPVLAALLLGKTAEAAERGIELRVDRRGAARTTSPVPAARAGHGRRQPRRQRARRRRGGRPTRRVAVRIVGDEERIDVVVEDSGPGVPTRGRGRGSSSAAGRPRPAGGRAASGSPWSARWRAGTAAPSTVDDSPLGRRPVRGHAGRRRSRRMSASGCSSSRTRSSPPRRTRSTSRRVDGVRGRRCRPLRRARPPATCPPTATSTWSCSTCTCPTATGSGCSSGSGPPGTCAT